jgi:hypothetical protein
MTASCYDCGKTFSVADILQKTLNRPVALAIAQGKQKRIQPQLAANIPLKAVFQAIQPLGSPQDPREIYFPAESFQFTA